MKTTPIDSEKNVGYKTKSSPLMPGTMLFVA